MSVPEISGLICAIAFGLISIFTAWMLFQLVRTIHIMNLFLQDIKVETIPLMTRFQTTMDHVNTELERVDGIVTAVESLSKRVNNATKVAQDVVTSPLVKALGVGAGAGKAYSKWKKRKD